MASVHLIFPVVQPQTWPDSQFAIQNIIGAQDNNAVAPQILRYKRTGTWLRLLHDNIVSECLNLHFSCTLLDLNTGFSSMTHKDKGKSASRESRPSVAALRPGIIMRNSARSCRFQSRFDLGGLIITL
jgi:hypothetical protein